MTNKNGSISDLDDKFVNFLSFSLQLFRNTFIDLDVFWDVLQNYRLIFNYSTVYTYYYNGMKN